jgi:hypothetical protein
MLYKRCVSGKKSSGTSNVKSLECQTIYKSLGAKDRSNHTRILIPAGYDVITDRIIYPGARNINKTKERKYSAFL